MSTEKEYLFVTGRIYIYMVYDFNLLLLKTDRTEEGKETKYFSGLYDIHCP